MPVFSHDSIAHAQSRTLQVEGKRKFAGDKPSLIMINAFSGKVSMVSDIWTLACMSVPTSSHAQALDQLPTLDGTTPH